MDGVESITDNVDGNISIKEDHCDTFVLKKIDKMVCIPNTNTNS